VKSDTVVPRVGVVREWARREGSVRGAVKLRCALPGSEGRRRCEATGHAHTALRCLLSIIARSLC